MPAPFGSGGAFKGSMGWTSKNPLPQRIGKRVFTGCGFCYSVFEKPLESSRESSRSMASASSTDGAFMPSIRWM